MVPTKCTFPGCGHKVKRKAYMDKHLEMHERKLKLPRPHLCPFENCEYSAALKATLTNHVRNKHTPGRTRDFQCPLCPSLFYEKANLQLHIGCHLKERRLKCNQCPFRTHDGQSLQIHKRVQHGRRVMLSCSFPGCNFSTAYYSALKLHGRIHELDPLKRRPLACSYPGCNYRTAFSASLTSHVSSRHNPSRTKRFVCALCAKAFAEKHNLRLHIEFVHTKEKVYHCDQCDYRTHRRCYLPQHCRRVHGEGSPVEKKLKCEFCDYRAFQKLHLDLHTMTKHSGELKFKCEHPGCKFSTNYSMSMQKHSRNHEDKFESQFPFACALPSCDFRRRSKAEMMKHERNHENCMPEFRCPLCPTRRYPDSKSLFFHKSLNHVQRTHKCTFCSYAVSYKSHLENHIRLRHSFQGNLQTSSAAAARIKYTMTMRYTSSAGFGTGLLGRYGCSLCNFTAHDEYSRLKHSVGHRIPVVALCKTLLLIL